MVVVLLLHRDWLPAYCKESDEERVGGDDGGERNLINFSP